MRLLRLILLSAGLGAAGHAALAPPPAGAFASGQYRNLFHEYLGKSDAEIDAKLAAAWQQLFYGDANTQRLFYPVPGDMAYIPDVANRDVRTEGLSYGMMICVQTGHQKEFNQLWKFAKHFMYHESGPLRGYFTWHTAYNGTMTRDDGSVIRGNGPAPDGEEWFVTALFFAAHRWGNGAQGERAGGDGIFNYGAEAQALLRTMLHKDEEPGRGEMTNMIHREARQVNFVPQGPGANYTDPSYHLPAFYELWARWAAAPEDRAFLALLAPTSRTLFQRVADSQTGLMPDLCSFDGKPARPGRDAFLYDAWRTLSNPALDWSWWAADPWEIAQANRVLTFLAAQGPACVNRFKLDGTPIGTDVNSPGLLAMAGSAALAADRKIGEPFVRRLWDLPIPDGQHRYYDGLLTMLALLEVSGNFRIYPLPGQN
jgi:oligosaccharide reducing-end xylanase